MLYLLGALLAPGHRATLIVEPCIVFYCYKKTKLEVELFIFKSKDLWVFPEAQNTLSCNCCLFFFRFDYGFVSEIVTRKRKTQPCYFCSALIRVMPEQYCSCFLKCEAGILHVPSFQRKMKENVVL